MAVEFLHGYNRAGGLRMNYKVLLNESDEGFSVSCPGLPGCWSQGATEEEALANIQEAIAEYLAAIDELVKGQDVREVRVAV
jgi:predicted RNase H-like HicB family nuclease